MKEEDKELALIDISARIPYGLKCNCGGNTYTVLGVYYTLNDKMEWEYMVRLNGFAEPVSITSIKPYLRTMSSMTKEEKKTYAKLLFADLGGVYEDYYKALDYLHKKHINYRLPPHLFIEVTEENNPYKD